MSQDLLRELAFTPRWNPDRAHFVLISMVIKSGDPVVLVPGGDDWRWKITNHIPRKPRR